MFTMKTQRLQENQRKYNERRQQEVEHKSKRLASITQSMDTAGRDFLKKAHYAKHASFKVQKSIKELEEREQQMI